MSRILCVRFAPQTHRGRRGRRLADRIVQVCVRACDGGWAGRRELLFADVGCWQQQVHARRMAWWPSTGVWQLALPHGIIHKLVCTILSQQLSLPVPQRCPLPPASVAVRFSLLGRKMRRGVRVCILNALGVHCCCAHNASVAAGAPVADMDKVAAGGAAPDQPTTLSSAAARAPERISSAAAASLKLHPGSPRAHRVSPLLRRELRSASPAPSSAGGSPKQKQTGPSSARTPLATQAAVAAANRMISVFRGPQKRTTDAAQVPLSAQQPRAAVAEDSTEAAHAAASGVGVAAGSGSGSGAAAEEPVQTTSTAAPVVTEASPVATLEAAAGIGGGGHTPSAAAAEAAGARQGSPACATGADPSAAPRATPDRVAPAAAPVTEAAGTSPIAAAAVPGDSPAAETQARASGSPAATVAGSSSERQRQQERALLKAKLQARKRRGAAAAAATATPEPEPHAAAAPGGAVAQHSPAVTTATPSPEPPAEAAPRSCTAEPQLDSRSRRATVGAPTHPASPTPEPPAPEPAARTLADAPAPTDSDNDMDVIVVGHRTPLTSGLAPALPPAAGAGATPQPQRQGPPGPSDALKRKRLQEATAGSVPPRKVAAPAGVAPDAAAAAAARHAQAADRRRELHARSLSRDVSGGSLDQYADAPRRSSSGGPDARLDIGSRGCQDLPTGGDVAVNAQRNAERHMRARVIGRWRKAHSSDAQSLAARAAPIMQSMRGTCRVRAPATSPHASAASFAREGFAAGGRGCGGTHRSCALACPSSVARLHMQSAAGARRVRIVCVWDHLAASHGEAAVPMVAIDLVLCCRGLLCCAVARTLCVHLQGCWPVQSRSYLWVSPSCCFGLLASLPCLTEECDPGRPNGNWRKPGSTRGRSTVGVSMPCSCCASPVWEKPTKLL